MTLLCMKFTEIDASGNQGTRALLRLVYGYEVNTRVRTHPIDISESARAKARSEPGPEAIFASRKAPATNCSLSASLPDRIQDLDLDLDLGLDTPDTAGRQCFLPQRKKDPKVLFSCSIELP